MLVTPDPASLSSLRDLQVDIAADSDYMTLSKAQVQDKLPQSKKRLAGWYYQQILKFDIVLKSRASHVLILDADTVLLKAIRMPAPDEIVFPRSSEFHEPYFRSFESLTGMQRSLKWSAIVNVMWFSRTSVADLVNHIERQRGLCWRQAILEVSARDNSDGSYSEYETYANWCAHHAKHVTQSPFRLFRRADLLLSRHRSVERIVVEAEQRRYDAIAFEQEHSNRTRLRRVAARALFSVGLCTNLRRFG